MPATSITLTLFDRTYVAFFAISACLRFNRPELELFAHYLFNQQHEKSAFFAGRAGCYYLALVWRRPRVYTPRLTIRHGNSPISCRFLGVEKPYERNRQAS